MPKDVTMYSITREQITNLVEDDCYFHVETDVGDRYFAASNSWSELREEVDQLLHSPLDEMDVYSYKVWYNHGVGLHVDMNESDGEIVYPDAQQFDEYLRENVFTDGGYAIGRRSGEWSIAEHPDGSGYMMREDMQRALDDDAVDIRSVDNGWLLLGDDR